MLERFTKQLLDTDKTKPNPLSAIMDIEIFRACLESPELASQFLTYLNEILESMGYRVVSTTSDKEETHDSQLEKILHAFDEIVIELHENWRIKHPTKLEKMLNIFRENFVHGTRTTLDDLSTLFQKSKNPRQAASTLLSDLNVKCEKHGFRIIPIHSGQSVEYTISWINNFSKTE